MPYQSIPDLFFQACQRGGDAVALRRKVSGRWEGVTWRRYEENVRTLGKGLIALGVQPGDKCAILSNTRVEWVYADLAVICSGAVTVPIYQSNMPPEVEYILQDSEAVIVFVEDEKQLLKVLEVQKNLPHLRKIVLVSGHRPDNPIVITLDDLMDMGRGHDAVEFERRLENTKASDIASIVYTSGTTGPPKGAMLSQEGFLFVAESVNGLLKRTPDDETLLFLPLAHIFARIIQYVCIMGNIRLAFAESIEKLLDNIAEIKPTFMGSVPRIYEKVYTKIMGDMQEAGGLKKSIFDWSLAVGREVSRHNHKGEPVPTVTKAQYAVARRLVFNKLKDRFGGRLQFFVSGGAPLSKEIAEFFHAADILILEGYGLTETTAVTNVNRPDSYRFGTVGQPIPGVEQKIAPDGEVLSRSPGIMKGYYRKETETREAIDPDGWFHTGDIGEFDADNFLRITDRKKDIIVTAGGKNIAPQNIENHLKTHPYISQAMVYGDRRKYCTALITLNYEEVARFAESNGISFNESRELATNPDVRRKIEEIIAEKNKDLASYESIKKFEIVPDDFTQETGELTPTLKVKRKVVTQKYHQLLDAMYDEKLYE